MTIYSINRGIGWASSGVEYAQAYRASLLRELGIETRFIFTDMFQSENIQHLTSNMGFWDSEIVWLYGFFSNIKIAPTSYPLNDFKSILSSEFIEQEMTEQCVYYRHKTKDIKIIAFFKKNQSQIVQRVEYLSKGKLIRKDYYSYTKVFSEYYVDNDNKPQLSHRTFFNEDGSVSYEEHCDGKQSLFRFPNMMIYSKEELVGLMLDQLNLSQQDIILMDRSTGLGPAILKHRGGAKVAVVIHAEHYNANYQTENSILWNNYYEYQLTNADKIDAFISSTEAQTKTLQEQLLTYTPHNPQLATIPVGSVEVLRYPEQHRKPFSLLTCSRLAKEKHIDWLIEAVVLAKQSFPEITFDIYGEGGEREQLEELITRLDATDYVRLMGHQDLTEVYQQYQLYVTASTSEGFGLTLLEAIASGLPMIGLDVPYGNQTFIDDSNGFLIPYGHLNDANHYASQFADRIQQLLNQSDLSVYNKASYQKAMPFLKNELMRTWKKFIKELTSDSAI